MHTINDQVLTEPIPTGSRGIKSATTAAGISYVGNITGTISLLVLADAPTMGVKEGDLVLISGKQTNMTWAKDVFEFSIEQGKVCKGILVPKSAILAVQRY